ncbi:MAG: hypothetical protein GQ531_03160 [Sulfurovum sp.]|nr:hypothetical protein [Sulfurovum sp.]
MRKNNKIIYPLLAKVGHKLEGDKESQAKELWEHYHDEEIQTYEMKRLSTFQDILDSKSLIEDIVMLQQTRKYSLDFDYKRKPIEGGGTVPHKHVDDIVRYRGVVGNFREKKKIRATPEKVEYYQARAKQNVRSRGTNKEDCLRHFLRALTQCVYPFKSYDGYVDIVKKLKSFDVTIDKLKNARRTPFVAQVVMNNSSNRSYVRKMLKALGYPSDDNYKEWIDLLMHKGLSNPVTMYD